MPTYKYKGTTCGEYTERFVRGFKTPEEDENHEGHCDCSIETCLLSRVMSKPSEPMGFKVWAGDWFKKTYGHDMGERDRAFSSEQAQLDKQVKELKKDHGIDVSSKKVE